MSVPGPRTTGSYSASRSLARQTPAPPAARWYGPETGSGSRWEQARSRPRPRVPEPGSPAAARRRRRDGLPAASPNHRRAKVEGPVEMGVVVLLTSQHPYPLHEGLLRETGLRAACATSGVTLETRGGGPEDSIW